MELTTKTIDTMKHMVGYHNRSKLSRSVYGRAFRTTRNNLVTNHCAELEPLIKSKHVEKSEALGMTYYFLTETGFELLSDILSIKIIPQR